MTEAKKNWTQFTIFKQLGYTPKDEPTPNFPKLRDVVCKWLGGEKYRFMPLDCPDYHDVSKQGIPNDVVTWKWIWQLDLFFKEYCPVDYQAGRWTFEGVVVGLLRWSMYHGYGAYELQILLNHICTMDSLEDAIEMANKIYNLASKITFQEMVFNEERTLTNYYIIFWDRLSAHIRNRAPLIQLTPTGNWHLAYHNMAEDKPIGTEQVFPEPNSCQFKFPNQTWYLPFVQLSPIKG